MCTSQIYTTQVQVLGYSTKAQTQLGLRFVPSQVQVAHATRCLVGALSPGGQYILSPPPSQPLSFLGAQWALLLRCAMCLSPGELISDCDPSGGCHCPGSQEDLVSYGKPAHSLVEDAISGAEVASSLLVLDVACRRMGQSTAG